MSEFDVDRLRRHAHDEQEEDDGLIEDAADEIDRLEKVVTKLRVRLRAQTHQTSITAQSISGKVNATLTRLDVVPEGVSLAHPCEQNVGTCIHRLLCKNEGLQEALSQIREAHRDDCAIYVAAVLGIIDAAIGPKQTENAE